jgi:hypothetical protein
LSWQYKKGTEYKDEDDKLKDIKNLVSYEWNDKVDGQSKQLREGFFSLEGSYFKPETAFRLKTAVNRDAGGRAANEKLFGYESLKAGSLWYFSVDFDDDNIKNKIKDALEKSTRIGKSRSAEYGKVKITPIIYEPKDDFSVTSEFLVIYCLSDLALRDKNGMPTLTPDSYHFNLEGKVDFVLEKSFIRTRTYSPYNNHRKANDLERQVICRGSVITFKITTEINFDELKNQLTGGIGDYRYDGLGKVMINPSFLKKDKPDFKSENDIPFILPVVEKTDTEEDFNPGLMDWLDKKWEEYIVDKEAIKQVETWVEIIKDVKDKPSNSQWRQLINIAMKDNYANIWDALFEVGKNKQGKNIGKGLCNSGVTQKAWDKNFYYKNKNISFRKFIEEVVVVKNRDDNITKAELQNIKKKLYLLGKRLPHVLNQQEEKTK